MKILSNFSPIVLLAAISLPVFAANADLPNYHQVDQNVYRGGQPTDEGFKALRKLGIKTVIDLRPDGEDLNHSVKKEAAIVGAEGMRYINVPLSGVFAPSHETMVKLLAMMTSPGDGPVFIHCLRGADRTGTVIASYRIEHDNWSNKEALREAAALGMSWHEFAMKHFVTAFRAVPLPPLAVATPAL